MPESMMNLKYVWICGACVALLAGCEDATIEGGSLAQDTRVTARGGAGVQGLPGSLESSTIDEAEWSAYLERASQELEAQPTIVVPWAKHLPAQMSAQADVGPHHVILPNEGPGAADYRVGDVLVSDNIEAGKIFLRRVTAVSVAGATTTYHTEDAAVTDVVWRGDLSMQPTAQAPGHVSQMGLLTQMQGLNVREMLGRFVPALTLALSAFQGGPWRWETDRGTFTLKFDLLRNVSFDNDRTQIEEFDVSIDWGGVGRALGLDTSTRELFVALNHPDHPLQDGVLRYPTGDRPLNERVRAGLQDGYRLRTSCESVIRALTVIEQTEDCRLFYNGWIGGGAPEVFGEDVILYGEGALPNVDVMTHNRMTIEGASIRVGGQTLRQLVCDSPREGRHPMPFPEQVAWAQRTCEGGALDRFDFSSTFAPQLNVGRAEIELGYAGSGEIIDGEASQYSLYPNSRMQALQDEPIILVDGVRHFRFFVGWLPVIMSLHAKLTHKPFSLEGAGSIKMGVERLLDAGVDFHTEVHYTGGTITSPSSWDTSMSSYDANFDPVNRDEFYIGDASGNLSLISQPIGLRTEVLFYDAGGFFVSGPNFYTRLDVNTGLSPWGDTSLSDEDGLCPIGFHSGLAFEWGIKGKIPLTDREADFQFGPGFDSCGAPGMRANRSFYRDPKPACIKHCFDFIPLQIYASWDVAEDVDLLVFDPMGRQASWRTEGIPGADHKHEHGCSIESTCQGPNYEEAVVWSQTPDAGTYRVILHNRSDEAIDVTGFIRAQENASGTYLDESIRVSVPANTEHEFSFPLDPPE
jgi:hypothetical protein